MATRVSFYHLQRSTLEQVLPDLLEKALNSGLRVVVFSGSPERVADLDSLLWTWKTDSWLPHGTNCDANPDCQPIYLTDQDENPNAAQMLVLADGVIPDRIEHYDRVLNLFDGRDDEAVQQARGAWKNWKEQGLELVYYQQTEQGRWQEKARAGQGEPPTA